MPDKPVENNAHTIENLILACAGKRLFWILTWPEFMGFPPND